jgi:hypothetical protein
LVDQVLTTYVNQVSSLLVIRQICAVDLKFCAAIGNAARAGAIVVVAGY